MGTTDTTYLNNTFDDVLASGGIYHVMCHPNVTEWDQEYAWVHLDYISNRKNIWYTAFGHLYAYHFIQSTYPEFSLTTIESKNIFDPNSLRLDFLIDSMQIDTQQLDSIPIIPNKIKHQLNDLSVIKINGKSSISNETIELDIESYNSLGKFSFSGIIGNGIFDSKKSDKTFSLNINLIDLDLSGLISKNMDFKLGTRLSIKGDLSNKNKPIFSWETNNSNISYRQMNLHGIKMQGRIEENQLRNTLSINSEALKLKSDALYNYNLKTPQTTCLLYTSPSPRDS